jgi:hypothetical protein
MKKIIKFAMLTFREIRKHYSVLKMRYKTVTFVLHLKKSSMCYEGFFRVQGYLGQVFKGLQACRTELCRMTEAIAQKCVRFKLELLAL